jgi:hypothetical protein
MPVEQFKDPRKMRIRTFLVFGLFLLFILAAKLFVVQAEAISSPGMINYQGKLLFGGKPATTTQNMIFTIYDDPTAGSALYTASGTLGSPAAISVSPYLGLFSVDLGGSGTNALDTNIFNNTNTMYIEVRVGGETLTPRKRITAVPYAFTADYLRGVGAATISSTQCIPISDAYGNFNFNFITSTNIYSSGNVTASNSVRSRLYCDVNGNNCFDPSSGWYGIAQVVTTTAMTNGTFVSGPSNGYVAANAICNAFLSGSHFCSAEEIIFLIRAKGPGTVFGGLNYGWVANGPPGYLASANDCNGWKTSVDSSYGPFWEYNTVDGGQGKLSPCDSVKPLSCCK